MVPSAPMVALPSPAPPLQPPRSMVPSLRFLPRWWDIAQVLLGVVTSLAVIAWLAVVASRGGKPVPGAPLAAAAPRCPGGLPRRGCPPAGLLLLGLHEHCKVADSLLYDFHRAYLFTSTMGDRRPPGPGGMHMGFSVTTSFGVRRLSGGQRGQEARGEARAEAPGDGGRGGVSQPARAIEEASPPTPTGSQPAPVEAPAPTPAPAQPVRDEVRDIWDNLFEADDNAAGQARARHMLTHVHHHFYDHFHHHRHQDEQSQNADAERLVTERPVVVHGHAHGHGHGHSHHIGPDGIPYAVFDGHAHSHLPQDPHGGPPTGAQRPQRRGTRAPDTTTTMVCYLFITLLVASGILAIGEVIRDWWTNLAVKAAQAAPLDEGAASAVAGVALGAALGAGAAASAAALGAARRGQQQLSRRCSLVDLTVSRHERRESLAHAQGQAAVGPLIGARPPPLSRRSSFPAAPAACRGSPAPSSNGGPGAGPPGPSGRPPGGLGERGGSLGSGSASPRRRPSVSTPSLSFDYSDGESSPDAGRKRVRIIRRH